MNSIALRTMNDIRFFLLAFWLGAATLFSFVVAPSLFSVLRQFQLANANEIAGTIVTRILSIVNVSGFFLSLVLIGLTLIIAGNVGRSYLVQLALFLAMAIATSVGHWLIAARMRAIRAALELPIDQIAATDPRRIMFANLHRYSVTALGIAMLAAIVSIVLIRARSTW
ncbi:MAG: hypothetical protein C5B44_01880 [Acidobacteria bacterium]|nr:MAG: hypothetical protein C5B44_01880 [Acidobacteriota bacterium]